MLRNILRGSPRLFKPVTVLTFALLACAGKLGAATTLTYSYDALGRLTFVNDPGNGNRDYDYDKAGNRLNVATGTASDSASEPSPGTPPTPTVPSPPGSLSRTYMRDCNWIAQWSPPGGQTSYQFKETANPVRTVSGSDTSTGVTCISGDPDSNKPDWIKACNANGCSAAAYF